ITSCVAIVSTKAKSGTTTIGMLAFERTVAVSETGSDFQNRMLRSRRSTYSASRQKSSTTRKVTTIINTATRSNGWVMLRSSARLNSGLDAERKCQRKEARLITKPSRNTQAVAKGAI